MKTRSASLFLVPLLALTASAAEPTDFIRVEEDQQAARLQTAVTRYEKDGKSVELVGAIHIADQAYYQGLQERFGRYDAVLYEMVGGENANLPKTEEEKAETKKAKATDGLHRIYAMVAKFLKLSQQMEQIDYTKGNFVHADVTLEEFQKLQADRGESVLGFAQKAQEAQQAAGSKQPDPNKLFQAVMSGSPNTAKLEIIHALGGGDDQVGIFGGESAIIGDRNAKCVQVLDAQLAKGRHNLAIFYGAAHFPDLEKRLTERGFRKTRQDWLTAWNVPKPAEAKPKPQEEPLKKAS